MGSRALERHYLYMLDTGLVSCDLARLAGL